MMSLPFNSNRKTRPNSRKANIHIVQYDMKQIFSKSLLLKHKKESS